MTRLVCRVCGASIHRRELTPEESAWRGGRTVVWIDLYGSAKTTGWKTGHYHEPEE